MHQHGSGVEQPLEGFQHPGFLLRLGEFAAAARCAKDQRHALPISRCTASGHMPTRRDLPDFVRDPSRRPSFSIMIALRSQSTCRQSSRMASWVYG
jgi:hypothetical protein